MKKIITILLALTLVFTLVGCSSPEKEAQQEEYRNSIRTLYEDNMKTDFSEWVEVMIIQDGDKEIVVFNPVGNFANELMNGVLMPDREFQESWAVVIEVFHKVVLSYKAEIKRDVMMVILNPMTTEKSFYTSLNGVEQYNIINDLAPAY